MTAQSITAAQATLESDDFPAENLRVRRLEGTEAISQLYRFELELVAVGDGESGWPDPVDVVGSRVKLNLVRQDGTVLRTVHGMVAAADERTDDDLRNPVWHLTVVPRAWRASLYRTQEVFLDLTVPEIIEDKLSRLSIPGYFRSQLTQEYPQREIVVQYGESDLDFISRLAEHLGIAYFFEQGEDGETMVFTDSGASWPDLDGGPVPYVARGEQAGVYSITKAARAIGQTYAVHDYNYRTPEVDLSGVYQLDSGLPGGHIEYGAHQKTPDEGAELAQIRAEEARCRQLVYRGLSSIGALAAGMKLSVDGHVGFEGQPLLLTELSHHLVAAVGSGGSIAEKAYENRFEAIGGDITYRPARRTPRPRIHGVVSAVVQPAAGGETGGDAEIDDEGRYKVRFHFDTADRGSEQRASQYVRMAQPFVGSGTEGMHFPLAPGTEVLITFIDGNPDRPILLSAVPNTLTPATVVQTDGNVNRIHTTEGITIQFGKRS